MSHLNEAISVLNQTICSSSCLADMVGVPISPWKEQSGAVERLRDADGYRLRAAAVCIKGSDAAASLLLVKSGKSERWVIPGGGVEPDETLEQAAVRELEEEAGVLADAAEKIGLFQDDVKLSRTTVFIMNMHEELDKWMEGDCGRLRLWIPVVDGHQYMKESQHVILDAVLRGLSI